MNNREFVLIAIFAVMFLAIAFIFLTTVILSPTNNGVGNVYVFPDGMTPVSYIYGKGTWLCENMQGQYITCLPEIIEQENP